MSDKKSILLVNDYGIYPELTKLLYQSNHCLTTQQLMRKAIKQVKKNQPDLLILEFFHEPQFRDRVSNIESILAQVETNKKTSKTLVLFYPGHESWLQQLEKIYRINDSVPNNINTSVILSKVESLLTAR